MAFISLLFAMIVFVIVVFVIGILPILVGTLLYHETRLKRTGIFLRILGYIVLLPVIGFGAIIAAFIIM